MPSAGSISVEERMDGIFKKGQNVSLTFPKHFGASNCKKERGNEGERQKGGNKGRNYEIELVKRSTSFNADNEVILQ